MFRLSLAEAYLGVNQLDLSVEEAQKGILANPKSAYGYLLLGQCMQTIGEKEPAAAAYREAVRLAQENGEEEIAAQASVLLASISQLSGSTTAAP